MKPKKERMNHVVGCQVQQYFKWLNHHNRPLVLGYDIMMKGVTVPPQRGNFLWFVSYQQLMLVFAFQVTSQVWQLKRSIDKLKQWTVAKTTASHAVECMYNYN